MRKTIRSLRHNWTEFKIAIKRTKIESIMKDTWFKISTTVITAAILSSCSQYKVIESRVFDNDYNIEYATYTDDGKILVTGFKKCDSGLEDPQACRSIWAAKIHPDSLNVEGAFEWELNLEANDIDKGKRITQLPNGNILILATTKSDLYGNSNYSGTDNATAIVLDSNGIVLNTITASGSNSEEFVGYRYLRSTEEVQFIGCSTSNDGDFSNKENDDKYFIHSGATSNNITFEEDKIQLQNDFTIFEKLDWYEKDGYSYLKDLNVTPVAIRKRSDGQVMVINSSDDFRDKKAKGYSSFYVLKSDSISQELNVTTSVRTNGFSKAYAVSEFQGNRAIISYDLGKSTLNPRIDGLRVHYLGQLDNRGKITSRQKVMPHEGLDIDGIRFAPNNSVLMFGNKINPELGAGMVPFVSIVQVK